MANYQEIPGTNDQLNPGQDYATPTKKCRLQHMQTEEVHFSDIAQLEARGGAMPDTLRIGIRMRYFAIAPSETCEREWVAYTLYHAHDRLINYWNLLMYFCYDAESETRLKTARSIKYYGVPDAPDLPSSIRTAVQNSANFCDHGGDSFPKFIEDLIKQLADLRTDKTMMPSIGEDFNSNFFDLLKDIYINFIKFFTHVYRKHYKSLCGMGILYHFNSFFVNIIHQGLRYNIIANDNIEDKYVAKHLQDIINEEEARVKGGM